MPEAIFGEEVARRCNALWWTVYVLDRQISALMGAPSSIRDEDITAALPSERSDSLAAAALTLQIKLSRLMATILTSELSVPSFTTVTGTHDLQQFMASMRLLEAHF